MTQLTLQIQENKVQFFLELIKNFDFVKVDGDPKKDIEDNIRKGLQDLKLIEAGKMKTTPLKDFLDEL